MIHLGRLFYLIVNLSLPLLGQPAVAKEREVKPDEQPCDNAERGPRKRKTEVVPQQTPHPADNPHAVPFDLRESLPLAKSIAHLGWKRLFAARIRKARAAKKQDRSERNTSGAPK